MCPLYKKQILPKSELFSCFRSIVSDKYSLNLQKSMGVRAKYHCVDTTINLCSDPTEQQQRLSLSQTIFHTDLFSPPVRKSPLTVVLIFPTHKFSLEPYEILFQYFTCYIFDQDPSTSASWLTRNCYTLYNTG